MEQAVVSVRSSNKVFVSILKYTIIGIVFYLLCIAKVGNDLYPFKLGLYLGLSFLGYNYLLLSLSFFVASVLSNLTLAGVVGSAICCGVVMLLCLLHKKTRIKISLPFVIFYTVLCGLGDIYWFVNNSQYVEMAINMALNIIFCVACIVFCRAWRKRNYNLSLNIDEALCGSLILMGLFCGFASVDLFGVDFVRLVASFVLLMIIYVCPRHWATMLGVVIGLGVAMATTQVEYIALFCCMGLVGSIFKTNTKILSCIAVLFADVLFGLYFQAFMQYTLFNCIMSFVGVCTFLLIPNKLWEKTTTLLFNQNNNYAFKNIVNQNKEQTSRHLAKLSEVFFEMDTVFRQLVKGNLSCEEAKRMLTSELLNRTCENCPNKNACMRSYGTKMQDVFEDLINVGFEKGRITLIDLPSYLTSRCGSINTIVNYVNELLSDYKKYSTTVTNLDNSRVLIADQLCGVSRILKNLSCDIKSTVIFDSKKEQKIYEELTYKDIIVSEVAVYEKDKDICEVTLVLKADDVDNPNLLKVVQKNCGAKMEIVDVVPAKTSGLVVMTLKTAPKFDIMFGLSSHTKDNSDISGDTHAILPLDNDKYLLALCDGMGSGQKANKASTLAISLVENFYKAGFDSDIILSSVNKLLNLGTSEVFSALDICVVDLKNSIVDFVKLGACVGFIKHKDTTTIIESGALPMGILQDINPKITKTALDISDMVVLVSDGIVDSFKDETALQEYINNLQITNPQGLADQITNQAISLNLGIKNDDMTVVVARIFARD